MINIIAKNKFFENMYQKSFEIGDYAVVDYDESHIKSENSEYIQSHVGEIVTVRASFSFGYCGILYDELNDGADSEKTFFIDFNDITPFKNKEDAEAYLISKKYNL